MEGFVPDKSELSRLFSLLDQSQSPDTQVQAALRSNLEILESSAEFNCYLMHVFARMSSESLVRRVMAGILLKNNIGKHFALFGGPVKAFLVEWAIGALKDSAPIIRSTSSSILSKIVLADGFVCWPALSSTLLNSVVESGDVDACKGAFSALRCVTEDCAAVLPQCGGGSVSAMIAKSVKFLSCNDVGVVESALALLLSLAQMHPLEMAGAHGAVPALIGLGESASSSASVRVLVVKVFCTLLEMRDPELDEHMRRVMSCVFANTAAAGDCQLVLLECLEFWLGFAGSPRATEFMSAETLGALVPLLLAKMRFADDDPALDDLAATSDTPDRDEDVRPFIPRDRDDAGDPADADPSGWNVRKCAAAALDQLSHAFGQSLFSALLPAVQSFLRPEADWLAREAAILALGAVAQGCMDAVAQHLPALVPFLLELMAHDPNPLVKSITCWTLGRYSSWIVNEGAESVFDTFITLILERMLDPNKKVQQAAISALACLQDETATHLLAPYLTAMVNTFNRAFLTYQKRNVLILYETLGQFCGVLQHELRDPAQIELVIQPLIGKWHAFPDSDRALLPLFECLTSVALSLGPAFEPYAPNIMRRCVNIMRANADREESDFLNVAMGLLSGIAEALTTTTTFVQNATELELVTPLLVPKLVRHSSLVCRQAALALLGDCAKHAFPTVLPVVHEAVLACFDNIRAPRESVPVLNNAVWSIAEIVKQIGATTDAAAANAIADVVLNDLDALVNVFNEHKHACKHVCDNCGIAIGAVAFIWPSFVTKYLDASLGPMCSSLLSIANDDEKDIPLKGILRAIHANTSVIPKHMEPLCRAILSSKRQEPRVMLINILNEIQSTSTLSSAINAMPNDVRFSMENLIADARKG